MLIEIFEISIRVEHCVAVGRVHWLAADFREFRGLGWSLGLLPGTFGLLAPKLFLAAHR